MEKLFIETLAGKRGVSAYELYLDIEVC